MEVAASGKVSGGTNSSYFERSLLVHTVVAETDNYRARDINSCDSNHVNSAPALLEFLFSNSV